MSRFTTGAHPLLEPGSVTTFAGPGTVNDPIRRWLGYALMAEQVDRNGASMYVSRNAGDFEERHSYLVKIGARSLHQHRGLIHDVRPDPWWHDDTVQWDPAQILAATFGRNGRDFHRTRPALVIIDEPGDPRPEVWRSLVEAPATPGAGRRPWPPPIVVVLTSQDNVEGAVEVEPLEMLQPGLLGMFVDVGVDKDGEEFEILEGGQRKVATLHWPSGMTDTIGFGISDDGNRVMRPVR